MQIELELGKEEFQTLITSLQGQQRELRKKLSRYHKTERYEDAKKYCNKICIIENILWEIKQQNNFSMKGSDENAE